MGLSDAERKQLKRAYERLEESAREIAAIEAAAVGDPPGVLMHFVLVTASRFLIEADPDDDMNGVWTKVDTLSTDPGAVATYQVLGLLEYAATRIRARIAEN